MSTPDLVLHHFPGACSRVSVCALEWAGLPYQIKLVNIAAGEQLTDAYRETSALGKVPALLVDDVPLLENAAILTLTHALRPQAGILPPDGDAVARAEGVGGLSFCGGTLHPIVRGLANPVRVTTGDGEPVRERSRELAIKSFGYAEARLAQRGWWLGDPSIVDVYLDWAFNVARRTSFDIAPFPRLTELEARLTAAVPSYGRMQEGEARARAALGL